MKNLPVIISAVLLVQASMAVAVAVPPAQRGQGANSGQGQARSVEARARTSRPIDRGQALDQEKSKAPNWQGSSNNDNSNRGGGGRGNRGGGGSGGARRGIITAGRDGAPAAAVEGFICPVDPTRATFSGDWGARRSRNRYHQGTDVFAPRETPLLAVVDGVVTLSNSRLGGVVLHVIAEDNTTYYYAHLSGYRPGLRSGDAVVAGDVIGFVGTSGNTGEHLPMSTFRFIPTVAIR